jgi:transposase
MRLIRTIQRSVNPARPVGARIRRHTAPSGWTRPPLLEALDELVRPETRGNPMSPMRWTLTSTYGLARELTEMGFKVSAELVRRLLHQMGYSLQAPAKQVEGSSYPDRNAQFEYLNWNYTLTAA